MLGRILVSAGVGGTAFLVASVVGFELFGSEFPSVFYVLPLALAATGVVAAGTYLGLRAGPGRGVRSLVTGVAGFSYSFFFFWFVSYSIPATRDLLSFDVIAGLSAVLAVAVGVVAWVTRPLSPERT